MKTIAAVNGVRQGVDVRTGVWRDSESWVGAGVTTGLVGSDIFGLGFTTFAVSFREGPGLLQSTGSILMPSRDGRVGVGSESESESSILQMGR